MSGSRRAAHWDAAYRRLGQSGGSWFQGEPSPSLELIDIAGVTPEMVVVDVGGGASTLVDRLLARGFVEPTVLDVSTEALALATRRLGDAGERVRWVHHDVLTWRPDRPFDLWHDRAVFHFLVVDADRGRYLDALAAATKAGSYAIVGTFAAAGPEQCSGLPVARYSPEALIATFGDAWLPVAQRREEHVTPEGWVQPFTWVAFARTRRASRPFGPGRPTATRRPPDEPARWAWWLATTAAPGRRSHRRVQSKPGNR